MIRVLRSCIGIDFSIEGSTFPLQHSNDEYSRHEFKINIREMIHVEKVLTWTGKRKKNCRKSPIKTNKKVYVLFDGRTNLYEFDEGFFRFFCRRFLSNISKSWVAEHIDTIFFVACVAKQMLSCRALVIQIPYSMVAHSMAIDSFKLDSGQFVKIHWLKIFESSKGWIDHRLCKQTSSREDSS